MASTRRRVKLFVLNKDEEWDERGTGHVSCSYDKRLKGMSLVVHAESDGSLLLESKIQPDTEYQRQQETLIVWSEGSTFHYGLALSFQKKSGCDEIWENICQVQGEMNPSVDITREVVEESEDEQFEDVSDSPIKLPPCVLGHLKEVCELIRSCLTSPILCKKLAMMLESESYIKKLIDVFHICEDIHNLNRLHQLYEIFKNIFLLNQNALFEVMFADDLIFDVVGILEYDPTSPVPTRHRDYLRKISRFREVIPISNPKLTCIIHQTYRVQYIQDIVLSTPSGLEVNMLSTLSSFISFNKGEIVSMLQEDQNFITELLAQLTNKSIDDEKRKDLVMLLKEFCMFSRTLQPHSRESFLKALSNLGILPTLEITVGMDDASIKAASIDILSYIVDCSPSMVREYFQQQVNTQDNDQLIINIIIKQMITDPDPELGSAVQLAGVVRILLDPENMLPGVNKSDFLNDFYRHCMDGLIAPMLANTADEKPSKEDSQTAELLGLILELLSFCVEHHTYHIQDFILFNDLLRRILVLIKSKHTFLTLCALRFMRKIIGLKDVFYNRYIIQGNLFAPVVDAFQRNNGRYNLLDSAIVEMFEFIQIEDVKILRDHIVERFGKVLDKVDYVRTFRSLRLQYEQLCDRIKDRSSVDSVSPLMRSNMCRRVQRQLDDDKQARDSEGKENMKTVPSRPFIPVMNIRRSNSQSVPQPLSPALEVKSPQLTRKRGRVDYPDEEEKDENDDSTNSLPAAKRPRISS